MADANYKQHLLELALASSILTFGDFKLKSNRQSPYFFNCGLFSGLKQARAIAKAYAQSLHAYANEHPGFDFDVLFGPAYKGVPLAATTTFALGDIDEQRWQHTAYAFNRKEAKAHGEGGTIVGEPLKGKRCVVIDDVMTAGTAIREAISIIEAQGGTLVGIIIALDRQEMMPSQSEKEGKGDDGSVRGSAIGEVRRKTGVPVIAVLTLKDIIDGMKGMGKDEDVRRMEEYNQKWGSID